LVNAAIGDCSVVDLGVVVMDELHMLDDESRGYILELMATKLLCLDQSVQVSRKLLQSENGMPTFDSTIVRPSFRRFLTSFIDNWHERYLKCEFTALKNGYPDFRG
jgi:hypothetical protein